MRDQTDSRTLPLQLPLRRYHVQWGRAFLGTYVAADPAEARWKARQQELLEHGALPAGARLTVKLDA